MSENANNNNSSNSSVTPATSVSVSDDDVKAIREHIRMEERSKLQSKLDRHDQLIRDNDELNKRVAVAEQKVAEAMNAAKVSQDALASLQQSVHTDNNVDVAKLIREVGDKTGTRIAGEMKQRIADLENTVAQMNNENARLQVEGYRQQRIAEETQKGTQFIRELITGNTREDIERSLQEAIAKHAQYFSTVRNTTAPGAPITPATPVSHGAAPVHGVVEAGSPVAQVAPQGEGVAGILGTLRGKKGKAQYAANREALLEAAEAEVASSNNIMVRN